MTYKLGHKQNYSNAYKLGHKQPKKQIKLSIIMD